MDQNLFKAAQQNAGKWLQTVDSEELKLVLGEGDAGNSWAFSPLSQMSVSIGADARMSISALNAQNDQDALAVFGPASEKGAPDGVTWQPVLSPDQGIVWLKYQGECNLKLGAAAAWGMAALAIDSQMGLRVASYMPHRAPFPTVAKAVVDDLASLPHVFDAAKVKDLRLEQAVAVDLAGSLSANLKLDWSDLVTGLADPLGGIVGSGSALAMQFDAGASVEFKLGIQGAYRVVFRGLPDGWIQLQVLTDRQRSLGMGLQAGVTVKFADTGTAQVALREVAGQLMGGDPDTIDDWKQRLGELISRVDEAHTKLMARANGVGEKLSKYLDGLGLESALPRLQKLQQRVDDLQGSAPQLAEELGLNLAEAQTLITDIQALPEKLQTVTDESVQKLWERLGLDDAKSRLEYALERLTVIEGAIIEVAETQIKLGFQYEYARTDDNAALLAIELSPGLSPAEFSEMHALALKLDGDSILARTRSLPEGSVRNGLLLGHRIDERRRAYGLTLGVGKWNASANWLKQRKVVSLRRGTTASAMQYRHSLLGQRAYQGKGFFRAIKYSGDLSVAMPDYLPDTAPSGNWDLNLNLGWETQADKFRKDALDELIDHAVLWAVMEEAQSRDIERQVIDAGFMGKRVRTRISLTLGNAAFQADAFAKSLGANLDVVWSLALAGALPWIRHKAERRSLAERERLYASVTPVFLERARKGLGSATEVYAAAVHKHLSEVDASKELINWEKQSEKTLGTFAFMGHWHRGFLRGWKHFELALQQLPDLRSQPVNKGLRRAEEAVDQLDTAWDDSYSLRAFGRLMVLLSRQTNVPTRSLAPKLCFEELSKKGEVKQSLVVVPRG